MASRRRHLKLAAAPQPVRAVDGDRVGRILLNATRGRNTDSIIEEAAAAGELPQLASALANFLAVTFGHMHGDDFQAMEDNAHQLISNARSMEA